MPKPEYTMELLKLAATAALILALALLVVGTLLHDRNRPL